MTDDDPAAALDWKGSPVRCRDCDHQAINAMGLCAKGSACIRDRRARRVERFLRGNPGLADQYLDHPYFEVRAGAVRHANLFRLPPMLADPEPEVRAMATLRLCKCFGIDEAMIERTVRGNGLTTIEEITNYTKAGGGCSTCAEGIEGVLERVNAEMVAEGALAPEAAFSTRAYVRPAREKDIMALDPLPAAKPKPVLTTLQKIKLIEQTIETIRPSLQRDGGDCELVDVDGNRVMVKLTGACVGCHLSGATIEGVQAKLVEALGIPLIVIPVTPMH